MSDTKNAFNPDKKTFKVMGQEFEFQFIPSIHFQFVLGLAVKIYMKINVIGGEAILELSKIDDQKEKKKAEASLVNEMTDDFQTVILEALEGRQYEILRDVLKYQNGAELSIETLKYQTRPSEIAKFMMMLVNDQETREAIGEVMNGLGKWMENPQIPSQMQNSTPSS